MVRFDIEWRAAADAFAPLASEPFAFWLHGGERGQSRWSTIVAFPSATHEVRDGKDLARLFEARSRNPHGAEAAAPFVSGLVGYIGYEAAQWVEPSLALPASPYALPVATFGEYEAAAVFDRLERRACILGIDETACERLRDALGRKPVTPPGGLPRATLSSNFSRTEYVDAVSTVIRQIREGDFFQANLSQCLSAAFDGEVSAFNAFRILAAQSDAPFGAMLNLPSGAVLSNSPELFFAVQQHGENKRILVEPIKGTRPRARDPHLDAAHMKDLAADPKDRAENIMIADLMRNDLSKICEDGSIREDAICELVSLAHVHHLVSRISGDLKSDASASDIIRALFPSGSITGAPKIEAMKTIAALERVGRGPYCGAIGYFDDRGGASFSVAIRTMMLSKDRRVMTVPVGGGVTLRSDPRAEYAETLAKATAAARAFDLDLEALA
ncbi:MAG: anthranilate synthase component I family protein [Pseudomonadota bacterium]